MQRDLVALIPAWLEATRGVEISAGLGVDEALRRAVALRESLRNHNTLPAEFEVDEDQVEVLHALCGLLDQSPESPEVLLNDARFAFEFISAVTWPQGRFGGREDLLSRCAFLGWRNARRDGKPSLEWEWLKRFGNTGRFFARLAAEEVLATPISERVGNAQVLQLEDPELLLCVCDLLRARMETSPATIKEESEFFYFILEKSERKIGEFDEREYFLGELALTSGAACRFLFRREEARQWFDRAEANFVLAANGSAHTGRLAYQRLALAVEERRFEEILEFAPLWHRNFLRLELPEDALKCRFLEGLAYWETGQQPRAIQILRQVCSEAEALRIVRLVAEAANNLVHFHSSLGESEEALAYSRKALPLLKQLNNRVGLAKLQWSIGDLLQRQRNLPGAIEAYRSAIQESGEIGMRGDVAALHLVLADVLLDAGQERQAEWEIRAALPIIDEEKMVPEGIAALSLLRESVLRRQIDRKALRDLHGYFRDRES